ncbi:uncharacterized protein RAG0_04994 [Rhynchosporium agropyri]|uniref:Uncharacterized protein n=1 Tax=Rhynchosporium agropyri TaxID=914238 RepID=A0A1E1KB24_9HELO|nr:uncharacterized protein RAG0_04994 [Rhynchosporium agropyri]
MVLTDIQPVPPTTSPSPPSYAPLHARRSYNGYSHVVAGGLLLLGNSDPMTLGAKQCPVSTRTGNKAEYGHMAAYALYRHSATS